jgi:ribosomal small subunit protein bTHX
MGRGDKKTEKGKRYIASYGNSRPQKTAKKTSKKIGKK